ncbi:unnamed protein product [Cyprideis torosa]|uniref:Uncharacterized protein n=1 Tax=Cyprideis torosa TaxID=163714 RepID=A0A7R8ZPF3_9CRUS|nr:unnamed protein product [Cyprideis torosa]CAG0893795.1 unnamed protein product [Cyprideis torosa]
MARLRWDPPQWIQPTLVLISSFLVNGIVFGVHNNFGFLLAGLKDQLKAQGGQDVVMQGSLVGSLAIGTTFFFSFITGVLVDELGLKRTAFLGGVTSFVGMLLSSYCSSRIHFLSISYGLIFGTGASLIYTPSLVILGHYFSKKIGIANGLVTCGSPVITGCMTFLIKELVTTHGLPTTFGVLSGLMGLLVLCTLSFTSVPGIEPASGQDEVEGVEEKEKTGFWARVINVEIWRNRKYVYWSLFTAIALFGYFVPYMHLENHGSQLQQNSAFVPLLMAVTLASHKR